MELGSNITVELNAQGEMIGIEILEASHFIRDSIMESVQARVLRIADYDALATAASVPAVGAEAYA